MTAFVRAFVTVPGHTLTGVLIGCSLAEVSRADQPLIPLGETLSFSPLARGA